MALSKTLYPSVDGTCDNTEASSSWATVRSAASSNFVDVTTPIRAAASNYNGSLYSIGRGFFTFDTSSIPNGAVISVARLYLKPTLIENVHSVDIHCVAATNSSTSSLSTADYDQVGSTSFGSKALSTYSVGVYGYIDFNATGIAHIDKDGYTKFACRTSQDLNNSAPPGSANNILTINADDASGTSNDPYLYVEYAVPTTQTIII